MCIQVHVEQHTTVHSDPARSIGEQPRSRSEPSEGAPPSHRGSEYLFLPLTEESNANSSDACRIGHVGGLGPPAAGVESGYYTGTS